MLAAFSCVQLLFPGVPGAQQSGNTTPIIFVVSTNWAGAPPELVGPQIDPELAQVAGTAVSLPELAALLSRLTERLQKSGLPLAQVAMTQSDFHAFVRTGALQLTVFPGKVGALRIENSARISTGRLQKTAEGAICPDGVGDSCVLTSSRLERMTLLLQDLPGVKLQPTTLAPDDVAAGETSVTVTAEPNPLQPLFSGYVGFDNAGFPQSGAYRLSGAVLLTNLFRIGDVLSLSGNLTNEGVFSGSFGASAPLGYDGLRGQASYVKSLVALPQYNTSGTADNARAGLYYPVTRSLDLNVNAALDGFFGESRQTVAGLAAFAPRDLYGAGLTLHANSGDRGIQLNENVWTATFAYTQGWVSQDLRGATDTTGVLGDYSKFRLSASRKQNISNSKYYVLLNFSGQVPTRNLDPSEKMPIGGPGAVRAYRTDEGSFDEGALLTVELRRMFDLPNGDRIVPGLFADAIWGAYNAAPYPSWQTNEGYSDSNLPNVRSYAGAGFGLDYISQRGFVASLSWATKLPSSPNSVNYPGDTNHFWFSLMHRF